MKEAIKRGRERSNAPRTLAKGKRFPLKERERGKEGRKEKRQPLERQKERKRERETEQRNDTAEACLSSP